MGFIANQVVMRHIFLQVLQFSLVEYHSTNTPHSGLGEIDLLATAVQRNLSWLTTRIKKKKYNAQEITSAKGEC